MNYLSTCGMDRRGLHHEPGSERPGSLLQSDISVVIETRFEEGANQATQA